MPIPFLREPQNAYSIHHELQVTGSPEFHGRKAKHLAVDLRGFGKMVSIFGSISAYVTPP